jgi:hypothetical protein
MIRYFFQLFCRLLFYELAGLAVIEFTVLFSRYHFYRSYHFTLQFVKALLAAFCYCACLPFIIKDGSAC